MQRGRRHHHQVRNPHAALLVAQLLVNVWQLEYKPPVTIALVAVNVLLFFGDLRGVLPAKALARLLDGALQPRLILERGEWWRLVLSAFLHLDEWHLYYNMSSLIWKGVQLERRYGSGMFVALVSELLLLSHGLYLLLTVVLPYYVPNYGYLYRDVRVAGFSAVLFGLKTVLAHHSTGYSQVMGINLPTKYVCWAELVLVSYLTPNVSFLGHLCGILAGLVHVRAMEPGFQSWKNQIRQMYARWVNAARRRRSTAQQAGRRLGGGGGGGGGGAGGAGGHSDSDDGSAAIGQQLRPSGAAGRHTAGGAAGSTAFEDEDEVEGQEEMRRRRLERLERSQPTASRYSRGLRTAVPARPRRSAAAATAIAAAGDPFEAAANRRRFNCGGVLGGAFAGASSSAAAAGGGGGRGGASGVGGSGDTGGRGGLDEGGSGRIDSRNRVSELNTHAAGRTAGTAGALTEEELRRRRLERFGQQPPGH